MVLVRKKVVNFNCSRTENTTLLFLYQVDQLDFSCVKGYREINFDQWLTWVSYVLNKLPTNEIMHTNTNSTVSLKSKIASTVIRPLQRYTCGIWRAVMWPGGTLVYYSSSNIAWPLCNNFNSGLCSSFFCSCRIIVVVVWDSFLLTIFRVSYDLQLKKKDGINCLSSSIATCPSRLQSAGWMVK